MKEIDGGYIIIARRLFESELMDKPALHLKLWVWMLNEANWKDRGKIKRGQLLTSIKEMREAMSYKIGYRTKTPTVDQIRSAYEAFTKATMITTTKTTRGLIVTILNFDKYQNPKNYEAHNESHNEDATKTTVTPHYMEEGEEREYKSTLTGTCPQTSSAGPPPCPHQAVIDLFHTILPELPRVRSWNETNKSHLRARWKSVGLDGLRMDSLEAWERLFHYIRTCPFLMGATQPGPGRKQFVAKLRWIVNQQNFQKIVEGDYEA